MSSVESYVEHRWVLDLSSEDMNTLRIMLEITLSSTLTYQQKEDFTRIRNLVECIE